MDERYSGGSVEVLDVLPRDQQAAEAAILTLQISYFFERRPWMR